jgi:hypothetical protein
MSRNTGKQLVRVLGVLGVAAVLCVPLWAQAQADSVSAGKFRGGWKDLTVDAKKQPAPQARYLLRSVLMGRTVTNNGQNNFGPFTNNSDYALTLVLNHVGGKANRRHYIWVDEHMVGKALSMDGTMPVVIQPRSTYKWEVVDNYQITAWVLTDEVIDVGKVSLEVGLPLAEYFANPQPVSGAYLGCVTVYEDRYLDDTFEGMFLKKSYSMYKYLWMSDGGAPMGEVEFAAEFNQNVVLGGAPVKPGVCFIRRERVDTRTPSDRDQES